VGFLVASIIREDLFSFLLLFNGYFRSIAHFIFDTNLVRVLLIMPNVVA
jgi:hypothetical protein